jgi:DnaJ-class molecular chaperone
LRQCPRCGGAGSYRFVDGNGNLQLRVCPSCNGMGTQY